MADLFHLLVQEHAGQRETVDEGGGQRKHLLFAQLQVELTAYKGMIMTIMWRRSRLLLLMICHFPCAMIVALFLPFVCCKQNCYAAVERLLLLLLMERGNIQLLLLLLAMIPPNALTCRTPMNAPNEMLLHCSENEFLCSGYLN